MPGLLIEELKQLYIKTFEMIIFKASCLCLLNIEETLAKTIL